jgi:hypothetical protein
MNFFRDAPPHAVIAEYWITEPDHDCFHLRTLDSLPSRELIPFHTIESRPAGLRKNCGIF